MKEEKTMTNNKELFLTWTKNLYYLQCAALIGMLVASLPFVGSWFGWVNTAISVGILFAMYKLSPVNARYRKAAIFLGISVVCAILVKGEILAILTFVASICSLVAIYQEYNGHSEMVAGIDEKLSSNWHSLFNWNFWGGIVVAIFGSVVVVIAGVALILDASLLAGVVLILTLGFDTIIRIVYLRFLKRTREVYENYEPKMEEEISFENMI